eukprot:CFRG5623T1
MADFDWSGLEKVHITTLKKPLLLIIGEKGFLGCGYINAESCNQTRDAVAIFRGVNTHEDILNAEVKMLSEDGAKLGMKIGMTGKECCELIRGNKN